MPPILIADLVLALIQALPGLIADAEAVATLLEGSAAAVRTAQAGEGTVPAETVQALGMAVWGREPGAQA